MSRKMTQKEMEQFLRDQCKEIEKYKWCLGISLKHDPLQDRSLSEIGCEWVAKYAGQFRKEWVETHHIE